MAVDPARVILWGDSLAWQAQDSFAFGVADNLRADVEIHTFPGTAMCDWLSDMQKTVVAERVSVAVLEFSGNALTPCMRDATGTPLAGAAYQAKYAADTAGALAVLRGAGAAVYLIGAPPHRGETVDGPGDHLRQSYRAIAAAQSGVSYVDAGASVLDQGRYTDTLPCLPAEGPQLGCAQGRIVVRAPDGAHFCPVAARAVNGVTALCAVWSSGAFRFGMAMAAPVIARLQSDGYGAVSHPAL